MERDERSAIRSPSFHTSTVPKDVRIAEVDRPQGSIITHPALSAEAVGHDRDVLSPLRRGLKELSELLLGLILEASALRRSNGWDCAGETLWSSQDVEDQCLTPLIHDERNQALCGNELTARDGSWRRTVHGPVMELIGGWNPVISPFGSFRATRRSCGR